MTTRQEARELRETWRIASNSRDVARFFEKFRAGEIVLFHVGGDRDYPSYEITLGPVACNAVVERHIGQFQVRYVNADIPVGLRAYGVYGRMDGSMKDVDWVMVDGPWRVGYGPFDAR